MASPFPPTYPHHCHNHPAIGAIVIIIGYFEIVIGAIVIKREQWQAGGAEYKLTHVPTMQDQKKRHLSQSIIFLQIMMMPIGNNSWTFV